VIGANCVALASGILIIKDVLGQQAVFLYIILTAYLSHAGVILVELSSAPFQITELWKTEKMSRLVYIGKQPTIPGFLFFR
jgi:hypothetical protein